MKLIFLSPHLDDAIFSCGALINSRLNHGDEVEVWTVCTADPPAGPLSPFAQMLHARWGENQNPIAVRRQEDQTALHSLNCSWRHLGFLDCIYREHPLGGRPLIQKDEDLFPANPSPEIDLIEKMAHAFRAHDSADNIVVAPLGVGRHIDHLNTRMAAESLRRPLWYYADFPYAAKDPQQLYETIPAGAQQIQQTINEEDKLAWQEGIASYASQLSSFWSSIDQMKLAVELYSRQPFALTLWQTS